MADRIDWNKLKTAYDDEDCILVLNSRVAGILSSIWHRLEWEATYRTGDYDYSDWDYLQRILADGSQQVGNPMKLSDLAALIDELEPLLRSIQQLGQLAPGCCSVYERLDFTGGAQYTDLVTDGIGDVPANIVAAGYASSSSDWTGYSDYKCMAAHLIVLSLAEKFSKLAAMMDTAGNIANGLAGVTAIIMAIWIVPPAAGAAVMLGAILGSFILASNLYNALFDLGKNDLDQLSVEILALEDELACSIFQAAGTTAAVAAFNSVVAANFSLTAAAAIYNSGAEDSIRALLGGRYADTDIAAALSDLGLSPTGFVCSCDPLGDYFTHTFTFDSSLEGWNGWDANNVISIAVNDGNPDPGCKCDPAGISQGFTMWLGDEDWMVIWDLTGFTQWRMTGFSCDFYIAHAGTSHTIRFKWGNVTQVTRQLAGIPGNAWYTWTLSDADLNDTTWKTFVGGIMIIQIEGPGFPNTIPHSFVDNIAIQIECQ